MACDLPGIITRSWFDEVDADEDDDDDDDELDDDEADEAVDDEETVEDVLLLLLLLLLPVELVVAVVVVLIKRPQKCLELGILKVEITAASAIIGGCLLRS